MILIFDSETTGLPSPKKELSDSSQPRIISLAAILTDDTGDIKEQMNVFVHHPGLVIPDFITKINGITQADCEEMGCTPQAAIEQFLDMKARSHTRVAHNLVFDKTMIAREELALGMEHLPYHGESFCTMQMCRTLGHKGKLADMYRAVCGRELQDAHTAIADVLACRDIFFKIRVN